MEIKDSGNRRTFPGGGVRDMAEGKGACWLLPLDTVADVFARLGFVGIKKSMTEDVLNACNDFIREGKTDGIYDAIINFSYDRWKNLETAILEVAVHYEMGAKKYEPRNWERIGNTDTFVDSAIRHYLKFKRGDVDEPHDRAFIWNMLGLLWTNKHFKENKDGD